MSDADRLGGILWINLDRRTDRREEMEGVLAELGLTDRAERFSAIERRPGILGCGLSHLECLRMARDRRWSNVLIFEDDFEPLVPADQFWKAVKEGMEAVGTDWDVLMLAYHVIVSEDGGPHFLKVLDGQTASAYVVNARFYDILISLYEWAMPKLAVHGEHWVYANDQVWKRLQPTAQWFAFRKRLGRQRKSFSDNTLRMEDYKI